MVAHLTIPTRTTLPGMLAGMLKASGDEDAARRFLTLFALPVEVASTSREPPARGVDASPVALSVQDR